MLKAFWHYCFNYNVPLIHLNVQYTNKECYSTSINIHLPMDLQWFLLSSTCYTHTYICRKYKSYWVRASERERKSKYTCVGWIYGLFQPLNVIGTQMLQSIFASLSSNGLLETMVTDSIRHAFVANSFILYCCFFISFKQQLHLPLNFVCLLLHLIGKYIYEYANASSAWINWIILF